MSFQGSLDARRRQLGLSVADVARKAQLPYMRVWYMLNGERYTDDEITRLIAVLDAPDSERAAQS